MVERQSIVRSPRVGEKEEEGKSDLARGEGEWGRRGSKEGEACARMSPFTVDTLKGNISLTMTFRNPKAATSGKEAEGFPASRWGGVGLARASREGSTEKSI